MGESRSRTPRSAVAARPSFAKDLGLAPFPTIREMPVSLLESAAAHLQPQVGPVDLFHVVAPPPAEHPRQPPSCCPQARETPPG